MSYAISKIKSLWKRLSDREYRSVFLDESVNSRLAVQLYSLRASRGMTQAQVSDLTGIAQPTLSKFEANCDGITTTTLKRIAAAYDVALSVRFVPFSELAEEIDRGKFDREITSYDDDVGPQKMAGLQLVSAITSPSRGTRIPTITSGASGPVSYRTENTTNSGLSSRHVN